MVIRSIMGGLKKEFSLLEDIPYPSFKLVLFPKSTTHKAFHIYSSKNATSKCHWKQLRPEIIGKLPHIWIKADRQSSKSPLETET